MTQVRECYQVSMMSIRPNACNKRSTRSVCGVSVDMEIIDVACGAKENGNPKVNPLHMPTESETTPKRTTSTALGHWARNS